jgi:hypothetical protein
MYSAVGEGKEGLEPNTKIFIVLSEILHLRRIKFSAHLPFFYPALSRDNFFSLAPPFAAKTRSYINTLLQFRITLQEDQEIL